VTPVAAFERSHRMLAAVDDLVDYRALVPLRILAGPLVLAHLAPFLGDAVSGVTPLDGFTVPYRIPVPVIPGPLYIAAVLGTALAAVLVSLGLFTRAATGFTAGFVVYNLLLSRTHYHHNRAFLAVLLLGLALVPVGETCSLSAVLRRRRHDERSRTQPLGRRWPLMLLRFQVAAVYVASGASKLLDPDWFGGVVTRLRVVRQTDAAIAAGVPRWLVDMVSTPGFNGVFAKIVVLTEIFIGVGLLTPALRTTALWVAVPFHLAIAATSDVEVFSWAALAATTIWVTPPSADRLVVIGGTRASFLAALLRGLDWTGRFTVIADRDAPAAIALCDRGGAVATGGTALTAIGCLLPASFLVAVPVRALRRSGVHSRRGSALRSKG